VPSDALSERSQRGHRGTFLAQDTGMSSILVWLVLGGAGSVALETEFVQQRNDFCGEAVVEMALRRVGRQVSQEDVFDLSGLDPTKGRGVWTDELARALRRLGFEPGKTWYAIDPARAKSEIEVQWQALVADLERGQPSIVCMHYDDAPDTPEHFRLVTGFDPNTDEVITQDPAEAAGANRRFKRSAFLALWPFKNQAQWKVIRVRLTPEPSLPVSLPAATGPRPANVAQHVMALKARLPKGATAVWEPPFLVIGDEPPPRVRSRAKEVVRWCRDLLLKDFFTRAPSQLHEVWVLKDQASYEEVSRRVFRTEPNTPYGFYLASRRALVMNIKPGFGTLTHELVHPFMSEVWPDVPAWLNEGVASLFERPQERDGHLRGGVNWRLPAVQQGLDAGAVPSFEALTQMSHRTFYDDPTGVNYATARYLCLWLQELGVLPAFVRRAIDLQKEDPTGWRALGAVLEAPPETRRKEWESFVQALRR
jgi:LmbE family N-acetylglucosaminyl deacetylase